MSEKERGEGEGRGKEEGEGEEEREAPSHPGGPPEALVFLGAESTVTWCGNRAEIPETAVPTPPHCHRENKRLQAEAAPASTSRVPATTRLGVKQGFPCRGQSPKLPEDIDGLLTQTQPPPSDTRTGL